MNNLLKTLFIMMLAFACIASLTGCTPVIQEEPDELTVLLDWTPNTNYSGIYAAIEEGFYEQEALSLDIVEAPGSVVQMVAAGQAEFGISYQEEVTYARLSDIPIISIAAIIQNNTSGFASLKERGIETPADFEGKSYGGWGSPVEEAMIKALMEDYDADFEQVDIITTGEVDSLIVMEREADFVWIYYGWTGIEAELKAMELNFIELGKEEPALNYYTPVIITSESMVENNPALVERFMTATTEGYRLAIEEPDTAADHLLSHAPELDQELVRASQKWLADKYQADAKAWGIQEQEVWNNYGKWLYRYELIDELPDLEDAYTNQFVR